MLRQVLGALPIPKDERILRGFEDAEDAFVYRLPGNDHEALVGSIDIITPVVDDPRTFGRIAAQNALSDLYAMGARPLCAMSYLAAPKELDPKILAAIVGGGAEEALRAGAPVLGGHSVEARDLMFGLSVMGLVHPDQIFRNDRATVGDVLVLTKPIGTGVLVTARKRDRIDLATFAEAQAGMLRSNGPAALVLGRHGVLCATDVSGFGLAGHAAEVAAAGKVGLVLDPKAVPTYARALELLDQGCVTRANARNAQYVSDLVASADLPPIWLDPQTSGGLLACVPKALAAIVLSELVLAGDVRAAIIGEVVAELGLRAN